MQRKNIISLIVLAASVHIQTSLGMDGAPSGTFLRLFNSSDRDLVVTVESGGERTRVQVAAGAERTLTTRARELTVDTPNGQLGGGGEACFIKFGHGLTVYNGSLRSVQEYPTGDLDMSEILSLAARGAGARSDGHSSASSGSRDSIVARHPYIIRIAPLGLAGLVALLAVAYHIISPNSQP